MNETDLEMEQGADLHSAAVPVDVTLFQEMKSRGLDLILYFKETLFLWDKPVTTAGSQGWLSLG